MDLLLSFYGDDFTGSTASLEALARAGIPTALFMTPPTREQLARYPGLRAVGLAGTTRSMSAQAIEAEMRPALKALRSLAARHVHYKVCSTFDSSPEIGSIGRVIDVAAELFPARFVPLLVAMPSLGRHCVFGHLFARFGSEGEVYRLDRHPSMRQHPTTPADESDLRVHLGRQTRKRIGLFDILNVALPAPQAHKALEALLAEGAEIILFDLLYTEQLPRLGELIDSYASPEQPLFSVGSSDVEVALAQHWAAQGKLPPKVSWPDPGPAGPLLVASGSCSPVTEQQIAWALAQGFAEVALDTAALAAGKQGSEHEAIAAIVSHLRTGRSVILHTSKGNSDPRLRATAEIFARRGLDAQAIRSQSAELFGSVLGRVLRGALEQVRVQRLALAGGDTSGYIARELGIESLEMLAPLTPGAPLCRAHAPGSPADGLEVSFKGGQVGSTDYFGLVARGKR